MKTLTTLSNLYNSLSNNTSTTNTALGKQLINDQHRYLLQKYFDNERTSTTSTVGGFTLSLTSAPVLGATSATLSSAWAYPTCTQLVNLSDGTQQSALFTYSSTAITWSNALIGTRFTLTTTVSSGATSATLASAWAYSTVSQLAQFSDGEQKTVTFTANSTAITWIGGLSGTVQAYVNTSVATTSISTVGVQAYQVPANISKIKNLTVNVGQPRYQPKEIMTRQEWDLVNVLPYTSDIPNYFFLYNSKINIYPIPSSTGNIISYNYKVRVSDLAIDDYTAGTITDIAYGSTTLHGSSTSWTAGMVGRYIQIAQSNSANWGDGLWYEIRSITNSTTLELVTPYTGTSIVAGTPTYIMGQMPLLSEDFQDMLVHGALMVYYSSVTPDKLKYQQFKLLYDTRLELLSEYAGTKTVQIDLGDEPNPINPNLFLYANN